MAERLTAALRVAGSMFDAGTNICIACRLLVIMDLGKIKSAITGFDVEVRLDKLVSEWVIVNYQYFYLIIHESIKARLAW